MGLDIPDNACIERMHHGHWQKAAGAWSWNFATPDGLSLAPEVGSRWPATRVARADCLSAYSGQLHDWPSFELCIEQFDPQRKASACNHVAWVWRFDKGNATERCFHCGSARGREPR